MVSRPVIILLGVLRIVNCCPLLQALWGNVEIIVLEHKDIN